MVKDDTSLLKASQSDASCLAKLAETVRQRIGQKRYDAWFQGVAFDLAEAKTLRVIVGSSLERDCLRKHFKSELREACQAAGYGKRKVEFVVIASRGDAPQVAQPQASQPRQPELAQETQAVQPAGGLRDVVTGDSNRQAVTLAALIASGELTPSPAVIWGPSGCGKTRLLTALRDEARRRNRKRKVVYLTAEDFTSGFVGAVHARSLASFRGRHRGADLLIIDDAQFLLGKPKTLEELQYTLDALAAAGGTVVLASDRSPADLRKVGGELLSRLGAGVSVEVASPDFATKRKLVERLAVECGLPLAADTSKLIAGGVIGGAWELRGVVNKLHLMFRMLSEEADAGQVQQTIDGINRISMPSVRIKDIQDAVCQVFGLETATIKSNRRTKCVTEPRMLAMWLARKYTQAAWSEIGESFGRRSHSTVINACRRVEELMDRRASIRIAGGACPMTEALRQVETRLRMA